MTSVFRTNELGNNFSGGSEKQLVFEAKPLYGSFPVFWSPWEISRARREVHPAGLFYDVTMGTAGKGRWF